MKSNFLVEKSCSLFMMKTAGVLDPLSQFWELLCFINIGWIGGATTLLRRFIKKQRAHFVGYIRETLQRNIKILKNYISWILFARKNGHLQSVFSPLWIPCAASDLVWEASGIPILASILASFHQNPHFFTPSVLKILSKFSSHCIVWPPPAFGEEREEIYFCFLSQNV